MFRLFSSGVDDLVLVSSPSNGEITSQLGARFDRELIYTNLGDVLIALNPYKQLPIFGPEFISMYQNQAGADPPPHIFDLAEKAYRRLVDDGESQCVIISGESGAGKTVSAKLILQYVTAVSPGGSGISEYPSSPPTSPPANPGPMPPRPNPGQRALPPPGGGGPPSMPPRGGPATPPRGGAAPAPAPAPVPRPGGPPPPMGGRPMPGATRPAPAPAPVPRPSPAMPAPRGGGGGGGGRIDVDHIKKVILDSNPLMEAIGNAKTVRNDNSSRFGKYLEIQFDSNNAPVGGVISTFLLEKSRVAYQQKQERNFHVFYQLVAGLDAAKKSEWGLDGDPSTFYYLYQGKCINIEEVDDANDFQQVVSAMNTVGLPAEDRNAIFQILAAILHIGNIRFQGEAPATVVERGSLDWAAYLLGVDGKALERAVNHRMIQTGSARATEYQVPQNAEQASNMRDALAKTLYERVFDYIVEVINRAMRTPGNQKVVGVLDIYGFEIFDRNSFEQFCINYVNEKLQQIFIDLTVRGEQREYHEEGMQWKDINFFDNKIVCDLIEGNKPPGIMRILDDVCRTVHALDSATADTKFLEKLVQGVGTNPHFAGHESSREFTIKHYAGDVTYDISEFCVKNTDNLYASLIGCMQQSSIPFLLARFPENMHDNKQAPTTAGTKIRTSAVNLVQRLSACTPHYIRCIKPNDKKQPMNFVSSRVEYQVKYLGLLENVKVKRAGYAYRHLKEVFLQRFGRIMDTMPNSLNEFKQYLAMNVKEVNTEELEEGKTKIFVKSPETIFLLEEKLFQKLDPEGYKQKVAAYKANEKLAQQKAGKHSMKTKCVIA